MPRNCRTTALFEAIALATSLERVDAVTRVGGVPFTPAMRNVKLLRPSAPTRMRQMMPRRRSDASGVSR